MSLVLYIGDKNYSSWSMRGWLPLRKAGLPFEERMILLRSAETPKIATISEAATVPTLQAGDLQVYESLAIAEWAAEQASGLWPEDASRRARARAAASLMHAGFRALRMACPMNMRRRDGATPADEAALADAVKIDRYWQTWLDRSGGPFLFGEWSIADAFYAPVVTRFITYSLERSVASQAWMDTMEAEPCFAEWAAAARAETHVLRDVDAVADGAA